MAASAHQAHTQWGCPTHKTRRGRPARNEKGADNNPALEYKKGPRPTRTGPSPQKLLRQSPTLPQPPSCSTISANGLSYRDRNGYPGVSPPLSPPQKQQTTTPNTPVRR